MDGVDIINLDGREVRLAKVEGSQDVFMTKPFILQKARWVEDNEAVVCCLCNNKFNQIRRKHHCRQCGKVLCSKCCKDKVPMPQLQLDDPERVCEDCKPVTELVTMSRSPLMKFQLQAAQGIAEAVKNPDRVGKVIELGGLQTVVFLTCVSESDEVRAQLASALHTMSRYPTVHMALAATGAVKAICSILSEETVEQTLVEAISALMIFCKSPELRTLAMSSGALKPVLGLCNMQKTIALLAVMTLNLMLEHHENHAAAIENDKKALPSLLKLTTSEDEQMQEVALKTLNQLALGTDWHRHRIIQESFTSGNILPKVLSSQPKNLQVISNAACLVANLATNAEDQISLHQCVDCLCRMLQTHAEHTEVLTHVSRGIANFAMFHHNTDKLVSNLQDIISVALRSAIVAVQYQGLRAIFYLLSTSPDQTITALMREGAADVLRGVSTIPGIMGAMQAAITKNAPQRVKPW
ncbi:uncharacterized protein [Branchiostoma lanceolatum]|uniref:uncharacterized protein n=1 Tax=Branchiostoma lanceolatum TaxID=7740 RepID=UPI0034534D86